jgi:hypothetical protein
MLSNSAALSVLIFITMTTVARQELAFFLCRYVKRKERKDKKKKEKKKNLCHKMVY